MYSELKTDDLHKAAEFLTGQLNSSEPTQISIIKTGEFYNIEVVAGVEPSIVS
ncbi:MAG: hypothetical protein ACYCZH_02210 [Sulfuriferula sp.]